MGHPSRGFIEPLAWADLHHFKGVSISFGTVRNSITYLQSNPYKAYEAQANLDSK
jgi:hypothetical protein